MKKIGLLIIGLSALFFAGNFTQAKDYEYTDYSINADVLKDGTMNIQENITANFFVNKHGIIRIIPLNYSVSGQKFHINVSNIKVKLEKAKKVKENAEWNIRIGKANKTIIGEHTYPISYTAYGLIRNFSGLGYSELYWNLVGYDFDTNINHVKAEIHLPKPYTGFTANDFLITTDGVTQTIEGFEGTVDWTQGDKIIITYDRGLPAYHGITLAVKFPNDYFKFDHRKQKGLIGNYSDSIIKRLYGVIKTLYNKLGFLGFIIILSFCACFILDMWKIIQQRRRELKYPVIIQYSAPDNLSPSEVGVLYSRCSKPSHVIGLLYKWASEGYISFKRELGETQIIKNKELFKDKSEIDYPYFENSTRKLLFKNREKISLPDGEFNENLGSLQYKLYWACEKAKGWFEKPTNDFSSSKQPYLDTKLGKLALCMILLIFFSAIREYEIALVMSFVVGAISAIFSATQNKWLTDKGYETLSHIKGYREFIKTCDENRMKTFLAEDPLFFDKTLPYAVVFGLETKFMKNFIPIAKEMGISTSWDNYDNPVKIAKSLNKGIFRYVPPSNGGGGGFSWDSSGSSSSYSSSSGHSGGSSFSGGFSSGGGGGGGGGRSW